MMYINFNDSFEFMQSLQKNRRSFVASVATLIISKIMDRKWIKLHIRLAHDVAVSALPIQIGDKQAFRYQNKLMIAAVYPLEFASLGMILCTAIKHFCCLL
jgi:hypothetical protein